ncbi:hypothetical protein [Microbulbifer aggregans]|uniref:hypothetical protein n=1 Tax=Microbulbifer aggregans TaxID=1769779 RepID=UPI001CFD388A|nr:hypothetical protein [Microbulbifer aggregans]
MKITKSWFKELLITLICWFIYAYFLLALFWAGYSSINPVLDLLVSEFASENGLLTKIIMYTHDALLNFLLVLPFAAFILKVCKVTSLLSVLLSAAVVSLVMNTGNVGLLLDSPSFALCWGIFVMLVVSPLAYIALRRWLAPEPT